jgi:ribosome-binding factor A
MQGDRMRKVNEAVREVVSTALTSGVNDERLGFITITGVETSPDLRNAVVFVSTYGNKKQRELTFEALDDLRLELQREIATHMRMKFTPVLRFEYDGTLDRSMRVSELINQEAAVFDSLPADTEAHKMEDGQ